MDQLIHLIIYATIFAVAAWGAYWIRGKSSAPKPAYWIVGAVFLIVILVFVSRFL